MSFFIDNSSSKNIVDLSVSVNEQEPFLWIPEPSSLNEEVKSEPVLLPQLPVVPLTSVELLQKLAMEWSKEKDGKSEIFFHKYEGQLPACLAACKMQPLLGVGVLTEIFLKRLQAFGGDLTLSEQVQQDGEEALSLQAWQKGLEEFLLTIDRLEGETCFLALSYLKSLVAAGSRFDFQEKLLNKLNAQYKDQAHLQELRLLALIKKPIKKEEVKDFYDLLEDMLHTIPGPALELCLQRIEECINDDQRGFQAYNRVRLKNISFDAKDLVLLKNFLDANKYNSKSCRIAIVCLFFRLREQPPVEDQKIFQMTREVVYRICMEIQGKKENNESFVEKVLFILCKITPEKINANDLFPNIRQGAVKKRGKKSRKIIPPKNVELKKFIESVCLPSDSSTLRASTYYFLSKIECSDKAFRKYLDKLVTDYHFNFKSPSINNKCLPADQKISERLQREAINHLEMCVEIPELRMDLLDAAYTWSRYILNSEGCDETKVKIASQLYKLARKKRIFVDFEPHIIRDFLCMPGLKADTRLALTGAYAEMLGNRSDEMNVELRSIAPGCFNEVSQNNWIISIINKSTSLDSIFLPSTAISGDMFKAFVDLALFNKNSIEAKVGDVLCKRFMDYSNARKFKKELYLIMAEVFTEIPHNQVDAISIIDVAVKCYSGLNSVTLNPVVLKMLSRLPPLADDIKLYAAERGLPAMLLLHMKKEQQEKNRIEQIMQNICFKETLGYLENLLRTEPQVDLFSKKLKEKIEEISAHIKNVTNELDNVPPYEGDPVDALVLQLNQKAKKNYQEKCLEASKNAQAALEKLPEEVGQVSKRRRKSYQNSEFERILQERELITKTAFKELENNLTALEHKVVYLRDIQKRLFNFEKSTSAQLQEIDVQSSKSVQIIQSDLMRETKILFDEALTKNSKSFSLDNSSESLILETQTRLSQEVSLLRDVFLRSPGTPKVYSEKVKQLKVRLKEEKEAKKTEALINKALQEEMETLRKQNTLLQKRLEEAEKIIKNGELPKDKWQDKTAPELWHAVVEKAELLQKSMNADLVKKYQKVCAKLNKRNGRIDKAYYEKLAVLCGFEKPRLKGSHGQYHYKFPDGAILSISTTTIATHGAQDIMTDTAIKDLLQRIMGVMEYEYAGVVYEG